MAPVRGGKKTSKTQQTDLSKQQKPQKSDEGGHATPNISVQTPASNRKTRVQISSKEGEMIPSRKSKHSLEDENEARKFRKDISIDVPILSSSSKRRREVEVRDTASDSDDDEAQFKTPLEKKHILFDDDDHEEFVTPMEAPLKNPLERLLDQAAEGEDEDEGSDDDAPPEAISTLTAKAQTIKSTQAAEEAAEKQADAKKQKRKDRDAFFIEQARSRRATKATAAGLAVSGLLEVGSPAKALESDADAPSSRHKRKLEAPALLPPELLESDSEEEEETRQKEQPGTSKTKKIKLDLAERFIKHETHLPQDLRVGPTVYRVLAERGDGKLAPKVTRDSCQLREKLLARHRGSEKKGGFLTKKR